MESCHVVDWLRVERDKNKRPELLVLRARQLDKRPEDIEQAAEVQWKSQEANKEFCNKNQHHQPEGENHEFCGGD